MPKNVIVVGMPRSGTSMVTGIFARSGYFVAESPSDELRPGDHHNPDGYWEADSLVERNVSLFNAAGYSANNSWLFGPMPRAAARRLANLTPTPEDRSFLQQYEAKAPWVWKDPRLCYTLAYWARMLDPATTRVVLAIRDAQAIYRSFVRLGWRGESPTDHADVMARIADHLAAAKDAIRTHEIPCLEVNYEDFASDPDGTAHVLSRFCELDLGPNDLGFNQKFDHSGPRGRLAVRVDRVITAMPQGPRTMLKKLTPKVIVRALFPERG